MSQSNQNIRIGKRPLKAVAALSILALVSTVVALTSLSAILTNEIPVEKNAVNFTESSYPESIIQGTSGGPWGVWIFGISFTHQVQHLKLYATIAWSGYSSTNTTYASNIWWSGSTGNGALTNLWLGNGPTTMLLNATLATPGTADYVWSTIESITLTVNVAVGLGMPVATYTFSFWIEGDLV